MADTASEKETCDIDMDKSNVLDTSRKQDPADLIGDKDPPPALSVTSHMPQSVLRIPVSLQVVIGSTRLPLSQIAQLTTGLTIALEQKLGAPATILVNGREVAKGEIFVLEDEGDDDRLGITITEVVQPCTPDHI